MKWTSDAPEHGDTRIVNIFAWLPVRMTDSNVTIWLESYSEVQTFWKALGWRTDSCMEIESKATKCKRCKNDLYYHPDVKQVPELCSSCRAVMRVAYLFK